MATNLLYHFRGHTRVQPYAFGGVGFVNADHTYRCVDCVFSPDPVTGTLVSNGVSEWRDETNKAGFTYGGGVKIGVHRHLSIRSEFLAADTTPGAGANLGWLQVQVGMSVLF